MSEIVKNCVRSFFFFFFFFAVPFLFFFSFFIHLFSPFVLYAGGNNKLLLLRQLNFTLSEYIKIVYI